jgi:type III pantothenate kinase
MILQIDAGNTRIKWRVLDGSEAVLQGDQLTASVLAGQPLALLGVTGVSLAQLSSVASETLVISLSKQVEAEFGIALHVAKVSGQVGAVSCGYSDPETLGVDRWMAVLGVFQKTGRASVVVDAGSAVTVDVVSEDGMHQGGYIVPGIRLLQESLWKGTDQVKVDQLAPRNVNNPGTSTEEAVARGCTLMLVALIERLAAAHSADLVITGGDAMLLKAQLTPQVDYYPDLVLDGLSVEGVRFSLAADR